MRHLHNHGDSKKVRGADYIHAPVIGEKVMERTISRPGDSCALLGRFEVEQNDANGVLGNDVA